MALKSLGRRGNVQLVIDDERAFPGLLIQGDTLFILQQEVESASRHSIAARALRDFVAAYEVMMAVAGRKLPYFRD